MEGLVRVVAKRRRLHRQHGRRRRGAHAGRDQAERYDVRQSAAADLQRQGGKDRQGEVAASLRSSARSTRATAPARPHPAFSPQPGPGIAAAPRRTVLGTLRAPGPPAACMTRPARSATDSPTCPSGNRLACCRKQFPTLRANSKRNWTALTGFERRFGCRDSQSAWGHAAPFLPPRKPPDENRAQTAILITSVSSPDPCHPACCRP